MKRIFSLFLAMMLVITMVPFLGTEANAFELEEVPALTITYKAGSGAVGTSVVEKFYEEEGTLRSPSSLGFTKVGYDFDGWKIGSKYYDAGDVYEGAGEVTATAQWVKKGSSSSSSSSRKENTYTVTYYPGDADGKSYTKTYDYNDTFTLIPCPYKYEKHKFEGWEYESGDVYPAGTQVSAPNFDVSFTAVWKKDSGIEIIDGKKAIDFISIKTKPTKTVYKQPYFSF